ncbi:MAG: hypothetical protein QG626_272 [Patescibacteria group bacterium]|nr:hypothetical protein [Patescibacteria group bacterium]
MLELISSMNEQPQAPRGFFDGNPKMLFVFGLVSGIALTLVLNNFAGIAIAAPSTGNNGAAKVAVTNPSADTGTTQPAGQLAAATKDDHVRGDLKKAKVVVIEYSDFQCPFCSRHHPTLQQLEDEYGDQIAWVYRHFPLSFHPNAEPTALASECADEQGKFWEFADAMFVGQTANLEGDTATANAFVQKTAKDLGLNMTKFNDCVSSAKYQSVVDADQASGSTAGVSGTPATFINGQLVSGAVPYATLKGIVDAELAK